MLRDVSNIITKYDEAVGLLEDVIIRMLKIGDEVFFLLDGKLTSGEVVALYSGSRFITVRLSNPEHLHDVSPWRLIF